MVSLATTSSPPCFFIPYMTEAAQYPESNDTLCTPPLFIYAEQNGIIAS